MRVGIDVVENKRFEAIYNSQEKMAKIYSAYEIEHIHKVANVLPRMAGLYAAKEAVVKALGIGLFGGLMLTDIEIRHDENGRPYLKISDKIKHLFALYGVKDADISISHTDSIATAICILM